MEQSREQGYENMVVNGLIDPTKNWGVAVPDKDYRDDSSLGQDSAGRQNKEQPHKE
jgi:hypothetical protein